MCTSELCMSYPFSFCGFCPRMDPYHHHNNTGQRGFWERIQNPENALSVESSDNCAEGVVISGPQNFLLNHHQVYNNYQLTTEHNVRGEKHWMTSC